jgi:hypothetical protein
MTCRDYGKRLAQDTEGRRLSRRLVRSGQRTRVILVQVSPECCVDLHDETIGRPISVVKWTGD